MLVKDIPKEMNAKLDKAYKQHFKTRDWVKDWGDNTLERAEGFWTGLSIELLREYQQKSADRISRLLLRVKNKEREVK